MIKLNYFMKKFDIPLNYSANIIDSIRRIREKYDPRKKDLSPSIIQIDKINFYIGRHFGFCYGVVKIGASTGTCANLEHRNRPN